MKKSLKRWLWSGALLFGFYKVMAPADPGFDDSRTYEPNELQQEFLRLSAQKYSYVAMGDTQHSKVEINLFALSPKTLSALHKGGVENIFIETSPNRQDEINSVRSGGFFDYGVENMWLCDQKQKDALTNNFKNAVLNVPGVNFIAADARFNTGDIFSGLNFYQKTVLSTSLSTYNMVYGCVAMPAFVTSYVLTLGTMEDAFMETITDDRMTAEYIGRFPGRGAVFYGAAHFEGQGAEGTSMRTLLTKGNKTITVINIFKDAAQEAQSNKSDPPESIKPDVAFYIDSSAEYPGGIKIINPEMRSLYDQAQINVRNGAKPAV